MRRGAGYAAGSPRRGEWHDNAGSDYSQDEDIPRQSRQSYSTPNQSFESTSSRTPSYMSAPDSRRTPSSHRAQSSGIPRASSATPSRLPSALKTPRSRSYSSSSSTDSQTINETVPPVPHVPTLRGRTPVADDRAHDIGSRAASYNSNSQPQAQTSLSRRSTSVSRSRSRSYSQSERSNSGHSNPSALPGSISDSDGAREFEAQASAIRDETPKTVTWAKDRTRFANPVPTSDNASKRSSVNAPRAGSVGSRYDQPPTPVDSGRRSSTKVPPVPNVSAPRSRIPSVSTRSTRGATEDRLSDREVGSRSRSRSGYGDTEYSRNEAVSHATDAYFRELEAARTDSRATGAKESLRSQNRYSSVDSKSNTGVANEKNPADVVHISSMKDMPLPVSPLSKPGPIPSGRNSREDVDRGDSQQATVSSPVETMLMGSAPSRNANTTPNAKRTSIPVRPGRESSVYVPSVPVDHATPNARRLSEPSPISGTPRFSAKDQPPKEQDPPPTILQRLARRASLSTGKSPKPSGTPKSPKGAPTPKGQAGVEGSSFDLDTETPRAATTAGASSSRFGWPGTGAGTQAARQDSSDRQKNRQSNQPVAPRSNTPNDRKKPRAKAVEEIAGTRDDVGGLGSPFMGDGSPRFGIDERFRSPRARTNSGLRHATFNDSHGEDSFDYYTSAEGVENTEDYLAEDIPIATVLSSPRDTRSTRVFVPPSPMVQSKKRSQYQYTGRARVEPDEVGEPQTSAENNTTRSFADAPRVRTPTADSHARTHGDRSRTRTPSYAPSIAAPTMAKPTTSSQSSSRSQFSDSPDERKPISAARTPKSPKASRRRNEAQTRHEDEYVGSTNSTNHRTTHASERVASQGAYSQPSASESRRRSKDPSSENMTSQNQSLNNQDLEKQPYKGAASNSRSTDQSSQLPVPKRRNTNSALFRALEQPYESSRLLSGSPADSSSSCAQMSGDGKTDSEYILTDHSVDGLHAVSSVLSCLNGDGVGDIRWSSTHELSSAAGVLFQNLEHSNMWNGAPQLIAEDLGEIYRSDTINGSPGYDLGEESAYSDDPDQDSRQQSTYSQRDDSEPVAQREEPIPRNKLARMSMQDKRKAVHESWRASLEEGQFEQLEAACDPMELQRQQAIWEFHESEEAFVDTLQTVLQLFVQPLRTQHQRQWIAGLAPDIMRLFDWLDDISNLHEQLLGVLDSLRQDQAPITIRFSEAVRPFVRLMELYQPYVVRVERVSKRIVSMVLEPESDFGEFVRMQSSLPDCGQGSLEEMLAKPLKRLEEYVDFFQRLLALTPRAHADYLGTFSLLHSMHVVTCVLREVKSQEEEYSLMKSLLSRVTGLPSGFEVANRERRLLAQGILRHVHIPENERANLQRSQKTRHSGHSSVPRTRTRAASQSTTHSSTAESTSSSYRSTSSSTTLLKGSMTEYSVRSESSATSGPNDGRRQEKAPFLPHAGTAPPPRTSRSRSNTETERLYAGMVWTNIYALVFTDFIILAEPVVDKTQQSRSPRRAETQEKWSTLDTLGVFWILGITDHSGHSGYEHLISLDLAPVNNAYPKDQVDLPVFLSVAGTLKGAQGRNPETIRARDEWFQSLRECYLNTLRTLSFPLDSEVSRDDRGGGSSDPLITDGLSRSLNFPKSPSQQLQRQVERKQAKLPLVNNTEEEREEREFWAKRFKVVYEKLRQTYEGIPLPVEARIPTIPYYYVDGRRRSSGTVI